MMAWISSHHVTSDHRYRINVVDPKHQMLRINHFVDGPGRRPEPPGRYRSSPSASRTYSCPALGRNAFMWPSTIPSPASE